jgi:DNA-binding MarR family transcriptional regulator
VDRTRAQGRPNASTGDAEPVDLLALENQVCFALAVAARRVIGVYRPILEPLELTHPQYLVMLALWGAEPVTVRALGERLSLEPATLSPLLKRLEAIGYLRRDRDPRDERALRITLTDAGRGLREQALRIPGTVMDRLGMGVAELTDLRDQLTEVIRRTDAESPPTAGADASGPTPAGRYRR